MDLRFKVEALAQKILPPPVFNFIKQRVHLPTKGRKEANIWLAENCSDVKGRVLSIGSGDDADGQGKSYREYFTSADSYTTSEPFEREGIDLVLDARNMPEIESESYDCVLCIAVLEHVDNFQQAFEEITRVLKTGGTLIFGVPFRQAPHMVPYDFWRFTEYGIRYMLRDRYDILNFFANDDTIHKFPAAYKVKAVKLGNEIKD